MKESYIGLSISVVVHLFIVSFLISIPLATISQTKIISVDFTLFKGQGSAESKQKAEGSKQKAEGRMNPKPETQNLTYGIQKHEVAPQSQTLSSWDNSKSEIVSSKLMASDPDGQVRIYGEPGVIKGSIDAGHDSSQKGKIFASIDGTGGGGQGRVVNYNDGDKGGRDFHYIRESIIKNIHYPDRARRMGWEGRVMLSFTLFENGSVHDIKIVNSSGFKILDESAKEAIIKTAFPRKVPYKLVVVLPIEYKLE